MPVGIHAQGFIGIAFETTLGTYVAPTKFFPVTAENLDYKQDTQWRRDIRGLADNLGGIKGFSHIEGDIEMYLMEDAISYFMYVMRANVVKTGAGPNYTHTLTPTHGAQTTTKPSLSITCVRNGVSFGYVGCVVSQLEISTSNGIPMMKFSIVGQDEASQALPTYTAAASSIPFDVTMWDIEIPTATPVTDTTDLTFTVNDNASPQYRLTGNPKAQLVTFGQREVIAKMQRDFLTRTEYDTFKALTPASITFKWTRVANNSITVLMPAATRETYEIDGLSSQGTLHLATLQWQGTYDTGTSKSYSLVVLNQENIV